jgi:hypothetical protein
VYTYIYKIKGDDYMIKNQSVVEVQKFVDDGKDYGFYLTIWNEDEEKDYTNEEINDFFFECGYVNSFDFHSFALRHGAYELPSDSMYQNVGSDYFFKNELDVQLASQVLQVFVDHAEKGE